MTSFERYIIKRVLSIVLTLWLISVSVFLIVNILPGNVALMILGQFATPEKIENLEQRLGLDEPLHVRYLDWISGVLTGDWGQSLTHERPIVDLMIPRLARSLELALLTMLIISIIGISLGVIAATKRDSWVDSSIISGVYLGVSLPEFVTGIILILLLGGPVFQVFPSGGYEPRSAGLVSWGMHIFLPAVTLAIALMAHVVRQTRSEMIEVLQSEYIRNARLKGLPERTVILKHGLRNSLLPVITLLAIDFGFLMGGLVVIEVLFAYPGIGRITVEAIQNRDIPVVQMAVLLIAFVYTVGNFMADLTYTYLDPRIEYE